MQIASLREVSRGETKSKSRIKIRSFILTEVVLARMNLKLRTRRKNWRLSIAINAIKQNFYEIFLAPEKIPIYLPTVAADGSFPNEDFFS